MATTAAAASAVGFLFDHNNRNWKDDSLLHIFWAFPSAACLGTALINGLPFLQRNTSPRNVQHALLAYTLISCLSCVLFIPTARHIPALYVAMFESAPLAFVVFALGFFGQCALAAYKNWPPAPRRRSLRAWEGWLGAALVALFVWLHAQPTHSASMP